MRTQWKPYPLSHCGASERLLHRLAFQHEAHARFEGLRICCASGLTVCLIGGEPLWLAPGEIEGRLDGGGSTVAGVHVPYCYQHGWWWVGVGMLCWFLGGGGQGGRVMVGGQGSIAAGHICLRTPCEGDLPLQSQGGWCYTP